MDTEESTTPAAPSHSKSKADRLIKLAFLLVVLVVAGWLVIRQYIGADLEGWSHDLPAALKEVKQGHCIVAVVYDSRKNSDFLKMRKITLSKRKNIAAMDEIKAIMVSTQLSKDDLLAVKYKITRYPTTLLIGSDGKLITSWTGYVPEVEFRTMFLKGKPQE